VLWGYSWRLEAGELEISCLTSPRTSNHYLNYTFMQDTTILWADDEIDLLKPHILFLNEKGYKVTTVTNGNDAVDAFKSTHFDLVFLDENMPGLTGLETLSQIKNINNDVPLF
jgi:CheY-like chemotaxis protein